MAKFCQKCGTELKKGDTFCSNCGAPIVDEKKQDNNAAVKTTNNASEGKSKIAAGILGIFLGYFGVHNFYLGYTGKAIAQLLLTLIGWIACGIGPIAAAVWGLIEGIMILTGSISTDADGNELVE